jgi:HEPN domain-containing protein
MLQELGQPIPRTHDLDALLNRLIPLDATLKSVRRGLRTLTRYAVDFRYPGWNATTRQMRSAIRQAERIRTEIRARLGLTL